VNQQEDAMKSAAVFGIKGHTRPPVPWASHLLTAERTLLALVLLGFGIGGILNLLPDSSTSHDGATLGGALVRAGFVYPVLKGIEVLLELYLGSAARRLRGCNPAQENSRTILTPRVPPAGRLGPSRIERRLDAGRERWRMVSPSSALRARNLTAYPSERMRTLR
jgi:hypothetical protein